MSYNLFLDDYRSPSDCVGYVHRMGIRPDLYTTNTFIVVTNFNDFCYKIIKDGLPDMISFDHDLADEHYTPEEYWDDFEASEKYQKEVEVNYKEKTGYDCAKWLIEYCTNNNLKLPKYYVHSMNPVGARNIKNLLEDMKDNFLKTEEDKKVFTDAILNPAEPNEALKDAHRKNEIKKSLYKEKPVAERVDITEGNHLYKAYIGSGGDEERLYFNVPESEMGENLFEDKIPAQLLIRWLI